MRILYDGTKHLKGGFMRINLTWDTYDSNWLVTIVGIGYSFLVDSYKEAFFFKKYSADLDLAFIQEYVSEVQTEEMGIDF